MYLKVIIFFLSLCFLQASAQDVVGLVKPGRYKLFTSASSSKIAESKGIQYINATVVLTEGKPFLHFAEGSNGVIRVGKYGKFLISIPFRQFSEENVLAQYVFIGSPKKLKNSDAIVIGQYEGQYNLLWKDHDESGRFLLILVEES